MYKIYLCFFLKFGEKKMSETTTQMEREISNIFTLDDLNDNYNNGELILGIWSDTWSNWDNIGVNNHFMQLKLWTQTGEANASYLIEMKKQNNDVMITYDFMLLRAYLLGLLYYFTYVCVCVYNLV